MNELITMKILFLLSTIISLSDLKTVNQKGYISLPLYKRTTFSNKEQHVNYPKVFKEAKYPAPFKTMNIRSYFNIEYFSTIYVGSKKQPMNVILDTGSDLLWLPSIFCTQCRTHTTKYNSSLSDFSKITNQKVTINYDSGNVTGTVVEDLVSLTPDNNTDEPMLKDFRIVAVEREDIDIGTLSDGILGMGIDTEGNNRNSFVYSLYEIGTITRPQFTFYLTDSKLLSRVYFGDIYQNAYLRSIVNNKNITHSCILPENSVYWACKLSEISLEKQDAKKQNKEEKALNSPVSYYNKAFYNSNSSVIFDTGTSYIIIPETDFLNLMTYLTAHLEEGQTCIVSNTSMVHCQCNSPYIFGRIRLHFDEVNHFSIIFEDIIDYYPSEEFQCHFQIEVDENSTYWIVGDSGLRNKLVTYDFDERKVQWSSLVNILNEDMIRESSNVDTTNTIYYAWMIAGAAFLALLILLAYCFMK